MVNKKGWIRVVEATIMVLLIISVLVFVNRERKIVSTPDINDILYKVLDELAKDDTLRDQILDRGDNNGKETSITESFLKNNGPLNKEDRIPLYLYYDLEICEINENCEKDFEEIPVANKERDNAKEALKKSDVFVSERILGEFDKDNGGSFSTKRIKLYAWRK